MPYAHRAYRVAAAKPTTTTRLFFSRVVVSIRSSTPFSSRAVPGRDASSTRRRVAASGSPASGSPARASPASTSRNHSTSSASWHAVSLSQNASSGWPPAPAASWSSTSSGKHASWIRRTSSTCARTSALSSTRTSSIAREPRGRADGAARACARDAVRNRSIRLLLLKKRLNETDDFFPSRVQTPDREARSGPPPRPWR